MHTRLNVFFPINIISSFSYLTQILCNVRCLFLYCAQRNFSDYRYRNEFSTM